MYKIALGLIKLKAVLQVIRYTEWFF